MESALRDLLHGPPHRFADWPDASIPAGCVGVYTVWREEQLLYVGMGGRNGVVLGVSGGLRNRLRSHWSGRRSGDQFCVYLCDRLLLPALTDAQRAAVGEGQLSLDGLVRDFVRAHLSYRFTVVESSTEALAIELHVQRHGLGGMHPLLNTRRPA